MPEEELEVDMVGVGVVEVKCLAGLPVAWLPAAVAVAMARVRHAHNLGLPLIFAGPA